MSKDITVYGLYPSRERVERALASLRSAQFRNSDVSVLPPRKAGPDARARSKGAAMGAGSGALLGGVLGCLIGAGELTAPGITGLLAGAFAGVAAGVAVGGLIGSLFGTRIPSRRDARDEARLRQGILIAVHSDDPDWAKRAIEVLEEAGADNIATV